MDITFYDKVYGDFIQKIVEDAYDSGYHLGYLIAGYDICFCIVVIFTVYCVLKMASLLLPKVQIPFKKKKINKESEDNLNGIS